ncbi:MAG TPA: carboxypeptidase-like regulatory domain-containing protein [Kofleriaceae bacterium]|nr:carboxypeptidase-like regulatory domain-containing protein [Kofleriaceae bacterium]
MKRNRRVAVIAGIGLVMIMLGAIAGAWWWHQDPGAGSAAASAHAPAPGARPAGPERNDRGELGPARVLVDDDPRGTLRLEGQVIDADDHGVAGATVVIAANPPRTATTEADGGFAFDGLIGRTYAVVARGATGTAGPVTVQLTRASDPIVLRLRPAGALTVTVVGTTGAPIAGATVELRGLDVQRAVVVGPAAVIRPVIPGNYQIAAWADGMAHAFTRIHLDARDAEARLVLGSGAPVSGKVVDDQGTGVAGARVRYSGASDLRVQASDRFDAQVTAADGSFAFDALPAGSFRLLATHPERAPGTSPLVTLDGKTAKTGVVIAMAIGATVHGHVVDSRRQPVPGARVRIGAAGGLPALDTPRQAASDAQGGFEIRGLPRKPLSAVALHESGSSPSVALDASGGDIAELTLTLELTGMISGRVVDPKGAPIEGAQVAAGPVFGAGGPLAGSGSGGNGFDPAQWRLRGLPEASSDASGQFQLTGLAPGAYRVSAAPARAQSLGQALGPRFGRGRADTPDSATAQTGDRNVVLVVAPDGGIKGTVAFADGTVPALFSASTPAAQQTFGGGDGGFALDGLAPGTYELELRGTSFQTRAVEITIEPAKTTDAGTITVVKGRAIAGTVVADGQPVAGATVYAGRTILGNGSTTATQLSAATAAITAANKSTTTDAAGAFSMSGFGDGDITLVAEQDAIGRSRALRLPAVMPGQTELTLSLEKFGALHGTLHQGGQPADGVLVTCQSTSTPGAVFTVLAGADGAYRFDRLAPDTYKVSATLGTIRTGMRFYAKQAEVPSSQDIALDLSVDAGAITLNVTATASGGVGLALVWLASAAITATTESELALKLAAAGPGAYQRTIARGGMTAMTSVAPGAYSLCVTPLPLAIQGTAAIGYMDAHGDALPAFCQPVTVAPAPDAQSAQIAVQVPSVITDPPGGAGSPGAGSGH